MSATPGGTVLELAASYARERGPEELRRLHRAVRRDPTYRWDLDPQRIAGGLLQRGAHAEVAAALGATMPGALLSPSAHLLLGEAFAGLGDAARAARERRRARLGLGAILGSGDGNPERPWTVLRISDEYDVLQAQGRRSRGQQLLSRAGRRLDRHDCDDGSTAWFDCTLLGEPE